MFRLLGYYRFCFDRSACRLYGSRGRVETAEHRAGTSLAKDRQNHRTDHEQGSEHRGRSGEHRCPRAGSKRCLAPAPPERGSNVPTLPLLQKHHDEKQQADDNVQSRQRSTQHRTELYRWGRAFCHDLGKAVRLESRSANERTVHVGLRRQLRNVGRLDTAAVDDAATFRRRWSRQLAKA